MLYNLDPLLVCYLFASTIAVVINWVVFFRWRSQYKKVTINELLGYIREIKPFPISPDKGWSLHSFQHGSRVWKLELDNYLNSGTNCKQTVFACHTKIETPAQVAAKMLLNIRKTKEWDPGIIEMNHIVAAVESNEAPQSTLGYLTQWDIVSIVRQDVHSWKMFLSKLVKRFIGIELHSYSLQLFQRYWNKEENGCCWLMKLDLQTSDWMFFLIQPLEGLFEPDHSILTVMSHSNSCSSPQPAVSISSFTDYLNMTKDTCVKLSSFNLPKTKLPTPNFNENNSLSGSYDGQQSIFQRVKLLLAQRRAHKREQDIKTANAIFRTKKKPLDVNSNTAILEKTPDNTVEFNKLELHAKNKTSTPCTSAAESSERTPEKPMTTAKRNGIMGTRSMSVSATMMNINGYKHSNNNNGDLTKSTSMDLTYSDNKIGHVSLDNYGEVQYRTISNQCAAELLAQAVNVSNMELSSSAEEQARVTGGWIFVGVEKDVVIMKKLPTIEPQHSYIGKGLIKTSPKTVWDAIRNPRTRFTYDDSLKKVNILHDFKNGMKIVYLYHEVSQLFKRECRDFCFVQGERVEKDQSLLTMHSVQWIGCPRAEEAIRGKFLSSGWIIEPVIKDRHIYSMVTYISQINLGSGAVGTLVEEIASKQASSIAALREYLVPTPSFIKMSDIPVKSEKSDAEKSSNTSCTTSEF
ncbi:uncharacterized protein LOC141913267 [Tubulanus polymorphus]|uniref:uncharacterized protein LOC141913267 n=1 Tax=Tubulanus polymorphus TaxID=672921 RepID=UPI003DA66DF2